MTDDTEFISVRLPADVANWLRQYATENNLIRAGKPNMGGSIISAIRERMHGIADSQTISNNVRQSDVEAIVNNAIAPLIAKIDKLEDDYQHAIINAKHEMRLFVIQGVTGAIDKPYFGIEETSETSLNTEVQPVDDAIATIPTEAIALSKKAPVLAPNLKALALEKILQVA